MQLRVRFTLCALLAVLAAFVISCEKTKTVEIKVVDPEFYVKRISRHGFEVAARGKIRNTGNLDVKNIVVTGECLSCPENFTWDNWFHNTGNIKTDNEKAIIGDLPAGAEKEFNFVGVAMFTSRDGKTPATLPEKLEVKVVSFEPGK